MSTQSTIPDPFPTHGVEIDDAGEYGDESVDVAVHRFIEIEATPEGLRLTAAGARQLAAALLAAADDLDRDDAR